MIDPDDRHFAGVEGAIAASAFAVVVGGVGIQAGAFVIRVAFGFFGGFFFDFSFFGLFAFFRFALPFFCFARPPFAQGDQPRVSARRFATCLHARTVQKHRSTMGGAPLRFPVHLPRLCGPLFFGFAVRAAAAA